MLDIPHIAEVRSTFEAAFATSLPAVEIALRLLMACAFGFIIGLDREYRQRPAGLRTNMMIALAAAVFAVIALEMTATLTANSNSRLDPIRVVEAVTSGVAFVAAGTIIQARGDVRGLTTGASMWLSGAVGLACGAGFLAIAVLATGLALVILVPLNLLERVIPHKDEDRSKRHIDDSIKNKE